MTNNIDNFYVTYLTPEHIEELELLFEKIAHDPGGKNFHPHAFTKEIAHYIAHYMGDDIYLGAYHNHKLIGYGLLRGWAEGYSVPSLGIYLVEEARNIGLSVIFMSELHRFARERGATSIRLKVYPENKKALGLYSRMGYVFSSKDDGQLIGYVHF